MDVLFGQTRRAILALFFVHSTEPFYLRQIARLVDGGLGAVQREIRSLLAAGLIRRSIRGKQILYQAETNNPIFPELKSLIAKTFGVVGIIREALMPLAERIEVAFVYGSVARQEERAESDVDLLIVGGVRFGEVVLALALAQKSLARDINPTVYPVREFRTKVARSNHFLTSVVEEKKLFVIGDKNELARLAQKRMAGRAQEQQARDRRNARAGHQESR
jgi:uncharacterized protein